MKRLPEVVAIASLLLIAACGGSSGDSSPTIVDTGQPTGDGQNPPVVPVPPDPNPEPQPEPNPEPEPEPDPTTDPDAMDCSVGATNAWIDAAMRDYYLYYDQVPTVNLADFDEPADLVEALRVNPPDRFSRLSSAESGQSFFVDGILWNFGFRLALDSDRNVRTSLIYDNSPADVAELNRGDQLLAVNGIPFADLTREQLIADVFAENEDKTTTFTFRSGEGDSERDVTVTLSTAKYTYDTVPFVHWRSTYGVRVGYLPFLNFIGRSEDELNGAFTWLAEENVEELILDLRYNGGGYTRIAYQLASQIAGSSAFGQLLETRQYNDKYTEFNTDINFPTVDTALGLQRVVILATGGTASSSEIVISSLRPYVDVVVVGEKTVGKPFSSAPDDRCGLRLSAMSAIAVNARGESVINGYEPNCAVEDNPLYALNDQNDAIYQAAYTYLETGNCPTATPPAKQAVSANSLPKEKALELEQILEEMQQHMAITE